MGNNNNNNNNNNNTNNNNNNNNNNNTDITNDSASSATINLNGPLPENQQYFNNSMFQQPNKFEMPAFNGNSMYVTPFHPTNSMITQELCDPLTVNMNTGCRGKRNNHSFPIGVGCSLSGDGGSAFAVQSEVASPGFGELMLTGKIGRSMKESCMVALTWVKHNYLTIARWLNVDVNILHERRKRSALKWRARNRKKLNRKMKKG